MRLEKFLKKYRIETRVKDEVEYRQVTISQHTGVKYRGNKLGVKIGRKRQFIVDLEKYPNTVMFTRQGLKDGAIGFATKEVHNCIVTENMPTLSVNKDIVDIQFLERLLNSNYFLRKISELSIVGSAQKSIHERDLLKLDIDIPDLETQKLIADRIISKEVNYSSLINEIQTQKQLLVQLKQSILQEAIQGKLTADWREQNPDTEPADELLKRIKAEKDQLIKDKKIKKEKALPPITEEEIPFELPDGWVWCRIPQILALTKDPLRRGPFGSSLKKDMFEPKRIDTTKVYEQQNAIKKQYNLGEYYISTKKYPNLNSFLAGPGDILISCAGTIGETYKLPLEAPIGIINQALLKIRLNNTAILDDFFLMMFKSQLKGQVNSDAKGSAMKNMGSVKYLKNELVFGLPPLEEQKAIVKKVETLINKCQVLEQEIKTSEANAQMLMQAVLKEAFEGKQEVVEV